MSTVRWYELQQEFVDDKTQSFCIQVGVKTLPPPLSFVQRCKKMTWLERTHRSYHKECAGQDALWCNADSINRTAIAVRNSTYIVSLACKYILSRSVIYRHYVVGCHYSCLTYSICLPACMQYNMMFLNGSSLHTSTLGYQVRLVTICFQLVLWQFYRV